MSQPTLFSRILSRIISFTPRPLLPILGVGIVVAAMLVAQAAVVAIDQLFGKDRTLHLAAILVFGASAGAAALAYGFARCISIQSFARPWVLALSVSATFWISLCLLAPHAIQTPNDVIALVIVIIAFTIIGGYFLWKSTTNSNDI